MKSTARADVLLAGVYLVCGAAFEVRAHLQAVPATVPAITELAAELKAAGVQMVSMEATSDHWRVWFAVLEDAQCKLSAVVSRLAGHQTALAVIAAMIARGTRPAGPGRPGPGEDDKPMVEASGAGSSGGGVLSQAGRELLGRLEGEELSPERALALSGSLRAEYPADLVAAGLTQQALRTAARAKFSLAGQMLFTRAGLEQASSELTARHAAARFAGSRLVADLCCGIGGNLIALAGSGTTRAIGVDLDLVSLEFARHNVAVGAPGASAAFIQADVTRLPLRGIDAVFIDPARREGDRRLRAGQSRPPLAWCLRLADAAPRVGVKAAPGLPRELAPPGWQTEFVAVGRDLKEALLWSPALAGGQAASRATVLPSGDTLAGPAGNGAAPPVPLAAPGAYLLDPNPAVTRAGLVAELAALTGTWQIDPMIAFLSSDEPVRTPFARTLRVLESAPWHERRFARRLRELGIGSADIRRRGLAGDVAQIRPRLGLRGPGAATLVLTRVAGRPWALICTAAAP